MRGAKCKRLQTQIACISEPPEHDAHTRATAHGPDSRLRAVEGQLRFAAEEADAVAVGDQSGKAAAGQGVPNHRSTQPCPQAVFAGSCEVQFAGADRGNIFIGFGLVFLSEFLDDRIREEEDITRMTNVRVLAGIPHLATPADERKQHRQRILEWCGAVMIFVVMVCANVFTFYRG